MKATPQRWHGKCSFLVPSSTSIAALEELKNFAVIGRKGAIGIAPLESIDNKETKIATTQSLSS
jgi:hypothetical protein